MQFLYQFRFVDFNEEFILRIFRVEENLNNYLKRN